MLRVGAHCSTAGGVENAVAEAVDLGCDALQIFARGPRAWQSNPLRASQIAAFREARRQAKLQPVVIHASYLINLASAEESVRRQSVEAFTDEVRRGVMLGADYLVFHPGSAKNQSVEEAIERLADSLAEVKSDVAWDGLTVLFENSAGSGASLGRNFDELAAMRQAVLDRIEAPLGFCLDTAHLFAAGFDIRCEQGLEETLRAASKKLGLSRVPVIHANDSKTKLGSKVDRHEQIGKGHIGAEAFERILRHPKLRRKAFVLETPRDGDGSHRANVEALRSLSAG